MLWFSASAVVPSLRLDFHIDGLQASLLSSSVAAGFLLTIITIHLIPPLVDAVGWTYAFAFLAPGPFLGVLAMAQLRAHPDALKLANGNR